jgi:hypothetical protein
MTPTRSLKEKSSSSSARNQSSKGRVGSASEIRTLDHYLDEPTKGDKRSVEDRLQLAFLRTFPKTICLAADENLEYPFYLMIKDQSLLKVHGSSIVTLIAPKPKWVCCQNLVLSSVTGRPMARVVVPISEKLLMESNMVDMRKALKLDKEKLPQKLEKSDVPSAFIRFLRGKNHNEFIQKELQTMEAYLETDEDKEMVLYFYTKDRIAERAREQRIQIDSMVSRIDDYLVKMAAKKNYLFSVSDRTKIHVNHEGLIVDVLGSQEFLTFMIKSIDPSIIEDLKEIARHKGIDDSMYSYVLSKDRNFISVSSNNKHNAKKLFDSMNKACRKRKTTSRSVLPSIPYLRLCFRPHLEVQKVED